MMSTICGDRPLSLKSIDIPRRNRSDQLDKDDDPYSSDHFRIYEFKVRKCNRSRSHDWTDCPFAHPGEKARRRDPRRFHYSASVCSEFRNGHCPKGDTCDFSHGVFECWLHPSRYRTEACKDGRNCKRKICFFAHSSRQLRIVPETDNNCRSFGRCCLCCHADSPTSTLLGHMSPPPVSPEFSHYGNSRFGSVESPCSLSDYERGLSYSDALTELMASFEAMNANESSMASVKFIVEEQPQFVMSPSSHGRSQLYGRESKYFCGRNLMEESRYNGGPDLGWVNDLLT